MRVFYELMTCFITVAALFGAIYAVTYAGGSAGEQRERKPWCIKATKSYEQFELCMDHPERFR